MDASEGFTHYQGFNDVRNDISDIELEELEEDELHGSVSIGQEHSESFDPSGEISQEETIPYMATDEGCQNKNISEENRSMLTIDNSSGLNETISCLDMIAFDGIQNDTIHNYENMNQIAIDDSGQNDTVPHMNITMAAMNNTSVIPDNNNEIISSLIPGEERHYINLGVEAVNIMRSIQLGLSKITLLIFQ